MGDSMKLKEIFKMLDERKIVLPDFQREYVWSKEQQKELIASLLLSLPVGSLLLLSGNNYDFATKQLGFPKRNGDPKEECKFLLDGQQRLTTLKSAFTDMFEVDNWEQDIRDVYPRLKSRWFLRVIPNEKEEVDLFGWKTLSFNADCLRKEEATSMEEVLQYENIGTTLGDRWYNPNYIPIDIQGNRITDKNSPLAIDLKAKEAAKSGLIPLYGIYNSSGNKSFLSKVIDRIADERRRELENKCSNNNEDLIKILSCVDQEIEFYLNDSEKIKEAWFKLAGQWKSDIINYFNQLFEQNIEVIDLPSDEIARAVVIFERINKGGTRLDNFDLIVAKAARDQGMESLNKRIINLLEKEICIPEVVVEKVNGIKPKNFISVNMDTVIDNEISQIIKKQYLNLLSIFSYIDYGKVEDIKVEYTKKEKILALNYIQINENTEKVIEAIKRACAFLQFRCGIVKVNELNYSLMLLPLAYILVNDKVWTSKEKLAKLEFWYWASIFSGEYRYNQNDRSNRDLINLYKWIVLNEPKDYEKLIDKVLKVEEFSNKDILLRKNTKEDIPVVIHKTILQYILSRQPYDFYYNEMLNAWNIAAQRVSTIDGKQIKIEVEDHHIIPLRDATKIGESSKKIRDKKEHILNSVLNRTLILSSSNQIIRDFTPEKYFETIEENGGVSIKLINHFIPSNYKDLFNTNNQDYEKILEQRFYKLSESLTDHLNKLLVTLD